MTGYALHCTLCKINYWSRQDWNWHLIEKSHQDRAKLELSQWTDEVRKCCVMLYSSFPLINHSSVSMVIQYFSSKGSRLATDFLISDRRPRSAILQFESKRKVTELFSETGGPSVRIQDQLVQLRKLENILELEWNEILLDFLHPDLQPYSPSLSLTGPIANFHSNGYSSGCPNSPTSHHVSVVTCANNLDLDQVSPLCRELQSIYKEVEIPDDEFNLVTEVIREMKEVLEPTIPGCFLALYRNNFLKLRNNPKSNTYLISITKGEKTGFSGISKEMLLPLSNHPGADGTHDSLLSQLKLLPNGDNIDGMADLGIRLIHPKSKVEFRYKGSSRTAGELQLSRLVAYYCNFDPRVKPLLTLLYFWAKLNDVTIGLDKVASSVAHRNLPDPTALEWILLFFLFRNKEIVPYPREIFGRQLKDPWVPSSSWEDDIRFSDDINFCQEWKRKRIFAWRENSEEFGRSVLEILKEFFSFCCNELSTGCVVNIREGKILCVGVKKIKCGYSKGLLQSMRRDKEPRIFIINPLVKKWRLGVDSEKWRNQVLPGMKITGGKLGNFLGAINSKEGLSNGSLREALYIK